MSACTVRAEQDLRSGWRQEMYQEKYLLNAIDEGLPEDKRSKLEFSGGNQS